MTHQKLEEREKETEIETETETECDRDRETEREGERDCGVGTLFSARRTPRRCVAHTHSQLRQLFSR